MASIPPTDIDPRLVDTPQDMPISDDSGGEVPSAAAPEADDTPDAAPLNDARAESDPAPAPRAGLAPAPAKPRVNDAMRVLSRM